MSRLPTSPEDITHRGVRLPTACVSGDLPLVALLLAEGAEAGIDMLAPDSVGGNKRGGVYRGCELLVTGEDPLHTYAPRVFRCLFFRERESENLLCADILARSNTKLPL